MRKHSSRIFIGCHITVILEEQDAYNMRCSAKEEGEGEEQGEMCEGVHADRLLEVPERWSVVINHTTACREKQTLSIHL